MAAATVIAGMMPGAKAITVFTNNSTNGSWNSNNQSIFTGPATPSTPWDTNNGQSSEAYWGPAVTSFSNAITGVVTLNNLYLGFNNSNTNYLGSTGGGGTITFAGTSEQINFGAAANDILSIYASLIVTNTLTINGGSAALLNLYGSNFFTNGTITEAGGVNFRNITVYGTNYGGAYNLYGMTIANGGLVTNATINFTSTGGTLTVNDTNQAGPVLNLSAPIAFYNQSGSGNTITVNSSFSGVTGSAISAQNYTLQAGNTINFNNASTNATNNTFGSSTITLTGGSFSYSAAGSGANSVASLPSVIVTNNIASTISFVNASTTNYFLLGNITRNDNSMLQFSIANAGTTGRVALTNSGSNLTFSGGILAWAVDTSGGGFITTNNVTGTNYLIGTGASTNANAKVADINAAAATDNYRFAGSGATNLNASTTVNSLYFAPSAAGTLSLGANTLTIASGGILQGNSINTTLTNGVITVGNGSGAYNLYLWNPGGANLIIGSQIADNGGNAVSLYKAGGTASILAASNSYTGATVIEGGSLINTNTGDLRNSAVLVGSTNMPTGATFYNYGIVSNVTVGIGSAIGNANTNFYNSGTILGRLNIVGGTNGGFSYTYGNTGLNYGIGGAYLDTGTVVTNVLLSGHMYVGGSGSMTVSGIVGDNTSTNSQVNFGTNFFGKGVITINNTYTNANSSGGQGVVLSFANGFNAIQSLNLNINSGQGAYFTLAGGSGSTNSFATFGYSSTGTPIINGITFSGGTWLLGIIGQNNSNGKDSSTHFITNGAIVNVAGSYFYVGAPTFNINQGSLNFTNANGGTIANSVRLTNSSLVINVNGSGTFTDAATLTLGNGNAAQIAAGQTSMLNINGGQAFIGGAVILGNGANNGNTNDYSFLGVSNNGVLTLSNNLTLGDGYTHVNQSNTVTLASGTMIVTGTIAPGAGASGASNSFFWTGGTLSAGTISATNTAAQSAWTGAAAGSSISNNTLYNTNSGTLLVGNSTNGYAGRTTINGNYTQSGSATTTFNIFGTTAAGSWTGATNNYSQLLISGTALYGGTVALNMTGYDLATSAATTLTLATNASSSSSLTNATLTVNTTNGISGNYAVGGYTNFIWLNTNGYGGYVLASSATNLTFTTAVNNWLGGANWGSGGTNGWNLGINPNTTKTVAYFGTNTGAALTVTNDAPVTVGGLVFSNSSGYTIVSTGTGSLTLDGSALGGTAMIRNQAGSHTISEAVTLATAMELTNSGAGSVTFTGGIYGPGAIAVDSGSLIFTNSVANIVSNSISGAGSVAITGPNTVTTISGSNTFAGGITLQGYSTMILGSTNAVGKGLFYWGGATISSLVDLSGGNALTNAVTINSGFDYVAGTNSITLAGAVTQTGGNRSIINNLSNNGVLTLSGPVYLDSGATARNLALSGTGNTVVSGSIADSSTVTNGSALTKSGTGTLTLSGSNSYTGGTTVSAGTLALSNSNALGANTGSLTLSGGTLSMGAYNATVGAVTIGNAALTFDSGGGTLTATSYAATNTVALTLSNSLAGTGTLTKTGAGTLTLTGVNSYLGGTTLSGGVLSLGSASAIGSSGTLTFNGGTLQYGSSNTTDYSGRFATNASQAFNFDLNGQNVTFANGLTNGGTTTLSVTNSTAGNGTLTLSGNNSITGAINNNASALNLANSGSQTFSSVISGVGTLIQSGTGTTTLAAQNTYTNTVVNGGTLNVTSGGSAGGIRGALTINSGGTVNLIGTNALGYSAGGAVTNITINGGTLNDALSNAGLVSMGFLQSIFMTGGTVASTTNNSAMSFSVANTAAITTYSNNATATFADNITLRATNISFNVAQGTAPGGIDLLVSGFIGQSGVTANITKTGAGTMLLSASNSYTGGTLISAGTLALTNGAVLGGGNVTNNASLVVSRTDSSTLTNAIFGNGSLTASGTGTVIFSGAQSYTGQTIITNGTLQLGNGSATGSLSSSSAIVDNGTLAFNRSNAVAQGTDFASAISGFGGIAQIGTGTVTLSGNNTYAGTTAISAGVLAVTGSGSLGSGAVANNGMLTLNSSANFAIGSMSGAGTFTKGGSGTVTLTGSPGSFSGSGTVTAGTLALANGAGMTGGNLAVNSGATIAGAGLLGNVTLNSGSTVAVTSGATAGTLTVSSLIVNGGTYTWNYQGSANDLISSTGTIDFSALTGSKQLTIGAFTNATSASWPTGSTNFTIMTATGGFNGFNASSFNISSFSTLSGGVGNWSIGTNGNSLVVSYQGGQLYALVASPGKTTSQSVVTNAFSGGSLSSVALSGGGEYILDLTNNYGGQTTIGAGTLTATGTNSFAQSSVIQVGTLTNSNAAATLNINTAGGVVTNAINVVGKGLNTITGTNAGVVTYGGNVALNTNVTLASVAGGDVILSGTVSGAGTATVSGAGTVTLAAGNTYSGGTVLNSGTLAVSNNAALGSGTLTVTGNSTVQALTSVTLANNATITNGVTETLDANGNNLTNSGNISGQGAILARSSTGAGTVTLSGSNNYTGASTVNSGALALGSANALPSATTLTVSGTGLLNLNGYNASVATISDGGVSTGVITNSAITTNTLTVSGSSASSFAGTIAGTLGLTKSGSGTLTIGGINSYNGSTVVNGGGLVIIGSLSNTAITVAGGTLTESNSGSIAGATGFTVSGGTASLNGNNTFGGGVTISAGLLNIGSSNALGVGTFNLNGGIIDNTSGAPLTIGNALTLANGFTFNGTGNLIQTNGAISLLGASTVTVAANNLTLAGVISGVNSLTKSGSGTLTLGGINTFTGATLVNGGGLVLNGSLNGSSITVTNATFTEGSTGSINGTNIQLTFNAGSVAYLGGVNNMIYTSSITTPLITVNSNAVVSFTASGSLAGVATNTGTRFNVLTINGGQVFFTNSGTINSLGLGAANQNIQINGNGNGVNNLVISNGASLVINTPAGNQGAPLQLTGGGAVLVGSQGNLTVGGGNAFNMYGPGTNQFQVAGGGTASFANGVNVGNGANGNNTILVSRGGLMTNTGTINIGSGATGGSNSLNNAGVVSLSSLYIGSGGTSTNELDTTGTLTVSTSGGFRMVSGVNTANFLSGSTSSINGMYIGIGNSTNLLTVYGNATLTTAANVAVGYTGGQSNTVVVNSGGVWNASGGINVGQAGAGGQNNLLSNNGTITAAGLSFNTQSGSGDVSKVIQNAGTMTVTSVGIGGGNGGQSNSYALLNVTGGVFSNSGAMTFQGNTNGNGTNSNNTDVFQVDGGTAYAGTSVTLGNTQSLTGSNVVNLNGGTLVLNGTLSATAGTQQINSFNWNGGTLSIATVTATGGGWNGPGSISNNTFYNTNAGILAPGTVGTAGKLNITGNYVQGGNAAMAIDLNGSAPATAYQSFPGSYYDTVAVSSNATLGGDLLLSIGNGFAPASNNSFSVLTASNVTGMINGAHTSLVNGATMVVATDGLSIFKATNTGTALNMTNYTFNQYAGGAWGSGGASSWTAVDPNSGVYTAYFGTNGGSGSVVMDQNRTVSALVFSNAVASSLTASGGSVLTLTNNAGVTTNASLTVSAGGLTLKAPVNLQSGLVITDTAGTSVDVKGNISESVTGSGVTIASNNTGLVTFYGTNSYTGATVVNGGYLDLTGTNALAAANLNTNKLSVGTGATLIFGVGGANAYSSNQINAALASGAFKSGSGIGYDATGTNFTLSSLGAVSSLTLAGSGTATVNQDNSGLSNGITLLGGTLAVGPSTATTNALGGGSSTLTLNGTAASKLDLGGTKQTVAAVVNNNAFAGLLTLTNGTLTFGADYSINVFGSLNEASNASINQSNALVFLNAYGSSYSAAPGATTTLAGSNNVYYFYSEGGSLALNNNFALGNGALYLSGATTLTSGTGFTNAARNTIDFSGSTNITVGGSLDFGAASVNAGTTTLNVASNGALVLTNGVSGGALTKAGSGTLILGGSNGTAGTTLNGGTILALGANSLGANLTLSSGLLDLGGNTDTFSTVGFYGTNYTVTNGSFAVTSGYTASNTAIAQSLSGGATFTSLGGNVYLTNANTYTGATLVTGGTLYSSLNTNTTYTVANAGSTFVAGAAIDTNWTAAAVASVVMNNGTILAIDATGTNFALNASLTNGANFTLGTYGTGTVTLADSATNYTGVSMLAISSGTLDLGGVSALSSMSLTNVTVSGGTVRNGTLSTTNLVIASNTVATIAANLVGTGALGIASNQVISLGGSNNYSGATTVGTNSTLNYASSGALSSTSSITANGGSIYFTNSGTTNTLLTNTSFTLNAGSLMTISNGARLNIGSGANTWYISLNGATLNIGSGGTLDASAVVAGLTYQINAGGTLSIASGGQFIAGMYDNKIGVSGGGTNLLTNAGTASIGGLSSGGGLGNGATGLNMIANTGLMTNGTIYFGAASAPTATNILVNYGSGTLVGGTLSLGRAANSGVNEFLNYGTASEGSVLIGDGGYTNTGSFNVVTNTGTLSLTGTGVTLAVGNGGTNNFLYNSGLLSNTGGSMQVGYSSNANGINLVTNAVGATMYQNGGITLGSWADTANNNFVNNGTVFLGNNLTVGNGGQVNTFYNTGTVSNSSSLQIGWSSNASGLNAVTNTASGNMTMWQVQLGNGSAGTNIFYNAGTFTYNGMGGTSINIGQNSNSTGLNEIILAGGVWSNTMATGVAPWMNIGNSTAQSGTNIFSLSGGAQYIGGITTGNANWRQIYMGIQGSQANILTNNGGLITNVVNLYVGNGSSNNANTVYVGNGTITTVGGNSGNGITVGNGGVNATNTMTVASGGLVSGNNLNLGAAGSSNNNTVAFNGGSGNFTTISVGAGSTNNTNTVQVASGATLSGNISLGGGGSNNYNQLQIFGSGTVTGTSQFYVGSGGVSNTNTMSVASGGVYSNSSTIQMQGANNTDLFTNNGGSVTANFLMMGAYGASNSSITYAQGSGTTTIGGYGIRTASYGGNLGNGNTNKILVAGGLFNSTNNSTILGEAGTNNLNIFQVDGGQANLSTVTMGATTNTNSSGGTNQINLNGGTLALSQITAGAATASAGSVNQVNLNGGTLLAAAGASPTFLGAGVANVAITGSGTINDGGQAITVGATIADGSSVGQLIKAGAGTLTLSGNNTYSAGTLLNAGGVNITTGSSLGLGNLTMAGGTTLGYTGTGASTLANNISLSSGNGTIANSSGSALNLSGNLSDNGSLLTFAKGSYNVSGNITGAYALSNAAMTLSGLNSYSAPASIFAGSTLNLGAHGSLVDSSVLNLGASSDSSKTTNTFNLGGYNQSLTSLATTGGGYNQVINSGSFSTLTLTGTSTFGGSFNGANIGLTIAGGNVTLTGTSSYNGTTTVNGGSLDLSSTAFLTATSNVIVQNGGTLLLGGTSANQIHANTPITMNGGTLSMGGNGSTRAAAQTFASLTLTGNSVIDFANLTGGSSLTFGTIALNNNSLSIYNWSGTNQYGTQSSTQVGTFTHLYDLNSGSLSSADLNNISFYSGGLGSTFLGNAAFSGNEIVPVPEPGVIVAAALLLGWLLFSNRRLLMAVVTRRRA
jgi:autotransporter-associated beta strand protein